MKKGKTALQFQNPVFKVIGARLNKITKTHSMSGFFNALILVNTMSLHGFINVTTTANQSAIINIDCITTIVTNVTDRNCKISTINGDVYPVFLSTCDVADLIKKAQGQINIPPYVKPPKDLEATDLREVKTFGF